MYIAASYIRKSTDREDNQINSIDYQMESIQRIAKYHKIRITEEIIESKSAKIEGARPGFNSMMDLIKKGKCNCILVDEPTRLSRNTIDTAYIIDLMEKWKLEAVITPSNLFRHDNFMEVEMLERYLGFWKLDNKNRSKHIKEKMNALAQKGLLLYKAPFWYKNKRISKWESSVIIDEKEKEYGMLMLQLTWEWLSFKKISEKLNALWLKWEKKNGKINTAFSEESVRRFITNSFYDWFIKYKWELIKHAYPLIFPQELLAKARERIGIRQQVPVINKDDQFPLRGLLKEQGEWNALTGYITKGNVYYKTQYSKINISQRSIIEAFDSVIDKFIIPKNLREPIVKAIKKYYNVVLEENGKNEKLIKNKISQINNDMKKVLDMYEAWAYDNEEREAELLRLKVEKETVKSELEDLLDINEEAVREGIYFIELFTNLSAMRKKVNNNSKLQIIKMIVIELIIDKEKRLVIQPNEVFELIQTSQGYNWWTKCGKNRTANLQHFARSILLNSKIIKRINENTREIIKELK